MIILAAFCFFTLSCDNVSASKRQEAEKSYISAVEAYANRDYDKASELARTAFSRDKNFYQAYFLEGKILFFTDNMGDAEKLFSSLVSKYPSYTEARIWHIRCLILKEKYERAQKLLNKELSFNTTDWRIYYLYSLLSQKTNNYDQRLAMNRRAETILTDSAKVYLDLALTWYTLGLEDRAVLYLNKARNITGNNISLHDIENAVGKFFEE